VLFFALRGFLFFEFAIRFLLPVEIGVPIFANPVNYRLLDQ